jgi:hypothetical protein
MYTNSNIVTPKSNNRVTKIEKLRFTKAVPLKQLCSCISLAPESSKRAPASIEPAPASIEPAPASIEPAPASIE